MMPNPFVFGPRIEDPAQFIGREHELRHIFNALETAHSGQLQHVSIVGPRRIGKSSLLFHIQQVYPRYLRRPEQYHILFIDLDDARCHTLTGLLRYILHRLNLPVDEKPSLAQFQEIVERRYRREGPYLVLCLDEFEHLTSRREEFPDAFYDSLRSLAANNRLGLITASKTPLDQLAFQGKLTSPFFNIFHLLPLGEFTPQETDALLDIGRRCDRPFSEEECRRIKALAGNHPAKLQIAAGLLYEAKDDATVDWGQLESEYRRQCDFIFSEAIPVQRSPSFPRRAWRFLTGEGPLALGRFLLEIFGRENFSDTT
ncbi:MAG: ATP-binding protein, partial [Anaerolineae bacterium]